MPAEWEPHRSTWLTWPKNHATWPGKLLKEVESIYLRMILELLSYERVDLLVDDQKTAGNVLEVFRKKRVTSRNLFFHNIKTVDAWIRDYGPIFVKNKRGKVAFTKWTFNAWGGKYNDIAGDNGAVDKIEILKPMKRFDPGIILEGGSIDMNGRGTCLTTEQCLLNPNRNKKLSRKEIESYFKKYLGVNHVIWLKEGIEGDDTDGHVDDITRFVGPRTILTATENDPLDENYTRLKENLEILKQASDEKDRRLDLVELPMPGKIVSRGGESRRLPASYANFYIANRVVLVPVYGRRNDQLALKIIQGLFPSRKIVAIESTALLHGLGSIHCVTQQEPL